ncbi:MAG: putative type dipeptide/oligopeptide transport system, permease component, partial [Ramlibacter sp.]|nr:putative type dipeptide/oligopeptide transport system, permease component [Ramlibacter sp.]
MSADIASLVAAPPARGPGFWQRAMRHRSFVLGAVLTLLLVLAAALSLVWTPHS